jgi:putative intracellular protease/amidase
MHSHLQGLKVAMLVANGFSEASYVEARRVWRESGAQLSLVSANQGLVNSWRDGEWGLNYPTDFYLPTALAADFDVLLVFGGRGSIDNLMMTAHTKRFLNGFMNVGKPVMLIDEAFELLSFAGHTIPSVEGVRVDGNLMTAMKAQETLVEIMQQGYDFVGSLMTVSQAA